MGRTTRHRRRHVAALVVALVVGGAACTSSDDGPSSGPAASGSPATTSPAPSSTTTGTAPSTTESDTTATTPTTTTTSAAPSEDLPDGRDVTVTSITDGDTFRAGDERIRLIGIDTPETAAGPECWGEEATAALTALIPPGTEVRLVSDVEPTDRYDRTLAYVHRSSDGRDVGAALLADGAAEAVEYPPNTARADLYAAAAAEARAAGRGLWGACTPGTSVPPASGPSTTTPAGATGGCDPSYPDVCIPPSPPDLDCGDIPHRRFRVLAPDPHRFDGGGDGIGCESG